MTFWGEHTLHTLYIQMHLFCERCSISACKFDQCRETFGSFMVPASSSAFIGLYLEFRDCHDHIAHEQ